MEGYRFLICLVAAISYCSSAPDPLDTLTINLNLDVSKPVPSECGVENKPKKESKCPKNNDASPRISGGCVTSPHQYPWMVRCGGCGGALITDRHVLTASHCSCTFKFKGKYVKVNVHNQSDPSDYEEVMIKDVARGVEESDIAILILLWPVNLDNKNIGTVCLPSSADKDYRGEIATAMGWGATHAPTIKPNDLLKHVTLTVDQYEEKYWLFTKVGWIDGVAQDPCVGDSGGPLVHKDPENGRFTVIGIVKGGGFDCTDGQIDKLQRWSKVTALLPWINCVIDEQKC